MKILFVNEYADPHQVSGAEYSMEALAKTLRKKHKVFILSPNLGGKSKEIKFPFIKKVKPGEILSPIWFNNSLFWIYAAYYIVKTVKDKKIDLIHVHGKYIQPAAVMAGLVTGKSVVTTVRDFKFLCPLALCFLHQKTRCTWGEYLNQEIPEYLKRYGQVSKLKLIGAKLFQLRLKRWLKRSTKVITVSPQLRKIYQQNGVKNAVSIYNLPPKLIANKRKTKNQSFTLISVGKLSYGKGTDSLLEAVKLMPKVKLILAGNKNPSLKTDFPPNATYLGQISHRQALKLYLRADGFVINSRWPEPLSRAGLEALAAGLPIIASNRGGNQELVKENSFLVDPDRPRDIARAVTKLIKADRKFLGQRSRQLLKARFNRRKIIAQHLELYRSLIK